MFQKLVKAPLAAQILVGLAIGAIIGLSLPAGGENTSVDEGVSIVGLIGQLWLRALQMTILPLVFALLSTLFIRSRGFERGGRMTRRAIVTILGLYVLAVPVGILTTYALLGLFPVTPDMAEAMRAMTGQGAAAESPPWAEAFLAVVPSNIVAAMSGESLLPVLVFALIFGAALSRLEDGDGKRVLSAALTGLADTIFIVVGWVLRFAPLGVAALMLPTTQAHGTDIFTGLAHFVSLSVIQVLVVLLLIYAIAVLIGRVPLARFARAMLPTQSVAFGTQSSTGCMPLTIESCRKVGLSEEAIGATIPLAAVTFRIIAPASAILVCAYAVAVYQMPPLHLSMLVGLGLLGILMEMSFVGIPGAATALAFFAPFVAIVGFPIEFIVVLLVVEVIPDVFKTVLHVTAHATAAAVVDRGNVIEASETAPAE